MYLTGPAMKNFQWQLILVLKYEKNIVNILCGIWCFFLEQFVFTLYFLYY